MFTRSIAVFYVALGAIAMSGVGVLKADTRADRPHIDAVYVSIARENFSLRAAIHAIVAHPAFGRK